MMSCKDPRRAALARQSPGLSPAGRKDPRRTALACSSRAAIDLILFLGRTAASFRVRKLRDVQTFFSIALFITRPPYCCLRSTEARSSDSAKSTPGTAVTDAEPAEALTAPPQLFILGPRAAPGFFLSRWEHKVILPSWARKSACSILDLLPRTLGSAFCCLSRG